MGNIMLAFMKRFHYSTILFLVVGEENNNFKKDLSICRK